MSEDQVTRLEEKLAHVEHALGELDALVYGQQQTIDALERRHRALEERLQRVTDRLEAQEDGAASGEERPPHY